MSTQTHKRKRHQKKKAARQRQIRSLLQGLFLGFCICLLVFSVWQLVSIFRGYRSGSKEYDELQQYVLSEAPESPEELIPDVSDDTSSEETESSSAKPMSRIQLSALKKMNADAIGWIEIPGTMLSYPLVHTSDNVYYLTHTFKRQENKSGAIFVETSNDADFSDLHTLIYGHNMKDGSMFACLKNYAKQTYYEAHPYLYVDLEDGTHCYQIFSCHEAAVDDISYTIGYAADDTYASFLNALCTSSAYNTGVSVGIDDSVITLSTCTNKGESRFVVHAKKLY